MPTLRLLPKFSKKYTSVSIKIDEAASTITCEGGYKAALAMSSCNTANIYYELQIENSKGYVRAGVATTKCEINGPIGMDEYGYSYGNKNGYGFHNAKRITFGSRFSKNDILSVHLHKSKGKHHTLSFYINGNKTQKSFENIKEGEYWPAISVYGGCTVSYNFGPYFAYEHKTCE